MGHDLGVCTKEVEKKLRCSLPGLAYSDLVYMDTPGIDNISKSNADVLKMVDNGLNQLMCLFLWITFNTA